MLWMYVLSFLLAAVLITIRRANVFRKAANKKGYDAYWDGVDVSDNPYDKETEAARWESWEASGLEARKHDYDESEE